MGMGIDVGTSVGVLGSAVFVVRGVNVEGSVGSGVKVSEGEIIVEVFSAGMEGETVGLSLPGVHAKVVVIKIISKYRFLIFIASLY